MKRRSTRGCQANTFLITGKRLFHVVSHLPHICRHQLVSIVSITTEASSVWASSRLLWSYFFLLHTARRWRTWWLWFTCCSVCGRDSGWTPALPTLLLIANPVLFSAGFKDGGVASRSNEQSCTRHVFISTYTFRPPTSRCSKCVISSGRSWSRCLQRSGAGWA